MLSKLFRLRPLIEELEPRILFSADLAPFALDNFAPVPEQRVINAEGEFSNVASTTRNELVIVNASVENYQTLLDDILKQTADNRHIDVVVLDAKRDGIEQISDALKRYGNLDALHLITHGESGSLQLGTSRLDAASLDTYAADIAAWGAAFNADADLLLYGCDVASGADGRAFVQRLAILTHADVAASDDLTGNAARGGDWDLEYVAGRIESELAFTVAAQAQWDGLLEALANLTTANTDTNASIATSPVTGAFVVAWTADGNQDGDKDGVYARVYDAAGNPTSGEILVNLITNEQQRNPAVAMEASGNFVVVWESKFLDYGIYGQRFDATGTKLGGQFLVNQTTSGNQTDAAIAMAADGQFVVAWKDDRNGGDIYVRHFDSTGVALSNEIRGNTNTASGQFLPAVAMDSAGNYVVTWQSDSGGTSKAIYAQRFNASDVKPGSEFRVNTYDSNDQTEPAIAMAPDGRFVIAWSSNSQDGSNRGIYAQRYTPSGALDGVEFRVNTHTSGHQDRATVAMDGSGNVVIVWTSDGQDNGGSYGVYAQRYFANGIPDGGEFRANATTSGDQQNPAAAMSSAGNLVIAWDGNGPGDNKGIFWQNYVPANIPPIANTDTANTDEDTPISSGVPGVLLNDTDPDTGAVLSVTGILSGITGTPTTVIAGGVTVTGTYGSLLIRQDGSYTYTPNATTAQALAAGQSVSDVFKYIIKDENNANASSTLTVTVNGLNDAPAANVDSYAVDKLGTLNIAAAGVLNNDTDVDTNPVPDTLGVVQVNGSAPNVGVALTGTYGTLTLNADGSLSYAPDTANPAVNTLGAGASVLDAFTYQMSDGNGGTSSTTLNITISGTNTEPVANNDAYAIAEDVKLTVPATGVLNNDTDAELNTLSAMLFSGVSNGTLVFNSNGSFTYTPNANYSGSDSFTYQVSDGSLTSVTAATVTLTVTPVNDDPVAFDDAGAVNQDATLTVNAATGVLNNDSDVDIGDAREVTLIEASSSSATVTPGFPGVLTSSYGTLTLLADGSYTYVADGLASKALGAGDTSDDTFTYTMQDAAGVASSATLTITITGSNDTPALALIEGTPLTYTENAAATAITNTLMVSDVDSTNLASATAQITGNYANGQDVLSFTNTASIIGAWNAATGMLTLSGPDTVANYQAALRSVKYINSSDNPSEAARTVSFAVYDGALNSNVATRTITVTQANDPPVLAAIGNQSLNEGATLTFTASATDADLPADTLTYALDAASIALGMSINASSGVFSWTPTESQGGLTPSVTVTVTDNGTGTLFDSEIFTITVNEVNAAPVGTDGAVTIDEDSTYVFTVSDFGFTDPGDSPANSLQAVKITTLATAGTLLYDGNSVLIGQVVDASDIGLNKLTFMPAVNVNGTGYASFTFQVQDNGGTANGGINLDPNPKALTINVTPVNDAPTATGSATLAAIAEDSTAPLGATVADLFTANFSNPDDAGTSAHNQFAGVAVRAQSTLAIATQGRWQYSTDSGASWSNFGVLSDTNAVSLGLNDRLRFMPVANYNGTPSALSVRLLDNSTAWVSGGLVDASVNGGTTAISMGLVPLATTVTPVNDAPVINSTDTPTVAEEKPASVMVKAIDVEGDTLAFSMTGGADAALFSLDPATGELKLIAVPNYETPLDANRDNIYEVVVTASDGKGGLASQAIHLVVGNVVEPGALPPDAPPTVDEPPISDEAVIQAAALVPDAPVDDMASQHETSNVPEEATSFYAEIHAAVLKPIQVMFHDTARNIDNRETGSFLTSINQALKSFTGDAYALQLLQNSLDSGSFQQQLNKLQETIRQQLSLDKSTVASTLAVSTGLSVGYVLWLVRGGVLLSSLLTSMPAWRLIDPLPILGTLGKRKEGDHDDDSLETLLKKSNAKPSSTPVPKPQVTDGNTP